MKRRAALNVFILTGGSESGMGGGGGGDRSGQMRERDGEGRSDSGSDIPSSLPKDRSCSRV